LFFFPGPVGLQGVDRENEGDVEQLLDQTSREVRIPRMAMNDIRLLQGPHDHNIAEEGIQQLLVADILGRKIKIETNPFHRDGAGMFPLFTEAIDIHLMHPALLAGELS
jgi:hypothetical protein